jgi:Ni,Fe-hydrogenase I cytochrome b subunit
MKNIVSLPINENIENTFYTKCIYQFRIFNKTCDYYIKNFIDNLYIYNISNDYKGLQKIFNELSKTKYKKNICESMKKYILYSKDTRPELEEIFLSCGDEYHTTFKTLKIFLEIQSQLNK